MTTPNKRSWIPTSSDKYLPIWVVLSMFFAVWVLSAHMTSAIETICKTPNRCYVAAVTTKTTSETKVESEIAAAPPAAAAPAASEVKPK